MVFFKFSFCFPFQNLNNRETILNKRNKLNDTKNDNAIKMNDIFNNKQNNIIKNNQLNNGTTIKNDTYESVCSPEDIAERNKQAQRHTMTTNNMALNNGRLLKRVVSAPVHNNESQGTK